MVSNKINVRDDGFNYKTLIDKSLLRVIREILEVTEQKQFVPEPHFFYITFLTSYSGVEVSENLKRKYPESITIIIRNQFKNLQVSKDNFSVILSFSGVEISVKVPFKSIINFSDPSAGFELEFDNDVDFFDDYEDSKDCRGFEKENDSDVINTKNIVPIKF